MEENTAPPPTGASLLEHFKLAYSAAGVIKAELEAAGLLTGATRGNMSTLLWELTMLHAESQLVRLMGATAPK